LVCVRAYPEPHDYVCFKKAEGAPVNVYAYRLDRQLGVAVLKRREGWSGLADHN
jgi:hypothetical protein